MSQHSGHQHRKRALAQSSGSELVLWCPTCKGQITRVKGQVSVPRLAFLEVKHQLKCTPKEKM